MCRNTFIIIYVLYVLKVSVIKADDYEVPSPKIVALQNGFEVSIPDTEGISLFAFHGNINKPMKHLEAGDFSKDILRKTDNRWMFKDTHTKLKVGDVISYWLFVIKDGLGYRYDDGEFIVQDITDNNASESEKQNKSKPNAPPNTNNEQHSNENCCKLHEETIKENNDKQIQIDKLSEVNQILSVIIAKDPDSATTMYVSGKDSTHATAEEFIEEILKEKLNLKDVVLVQAEKGFDNVVTFKMKNLNDKIKVIMASPKLKGTSYEIVW